MGKRRRRLHSPKYAKKYASMRETYNRLRGVVEEANADGIITEEEVAQITGQEGVSPVSGLGQTTNMLDVLRDSDFANEDVTAGASPVYVSQTELGDLDYEVLASLSGNTSVNALKEILQQG